MTPNIDVSTMNMQERWQYFMRKKYAELEKAYYPIVDDLEQKLSDMEHVDKKQIPDFNIEEFNFIKEWQQGLIDSKSVWDILKTWDLNAVAKTKLTRRLTNYMFHKEDSIVADYVREVRVQLLERAVPVYLTYLQMVLKYFEKLTIEEETEPKITWLEQVFQPDGSQHDGIQDYTFNQVLFQLNTGVMDECESKSYAGDNLIVFDEALSDGLVSMHWLFGPKAYIDEIKLKFNIMKVMDIDVEKAYIKRVVGAYVDET